MKLKNKPELEFEDEMNQATYELGIEEGIRKAKMNNALNNILLYGGAIILLSIGSFFRNKTYKHFNTGEEYVEFINDLNCEEEEEE